MTFSLTPLGDRCITVKLGDGISVGLSDMVVERAKAVSAAGIRGVTDVVPSYGSFGVFYDALAVSFDDLSARIASVLEEEGVSKEETSHGKLFTIPVAYDGEDIDDVCLRTSLSRSELIAIHTGREYRVFVVGFVPGFAYLGQLDSRLIVPRRESPRKRVPAGSVAIAEAQTGIYPSEIPGGWNLIGRTNEKMFDPSRLDPALLKVGDRVRFEEAK